MTGPTPEQRKTAIEINKKRNLDRISGFEDVFDVLLCAGYRFVKVNAPLRERQESKQYAVRWCTCGKDHGSGLASKCPDPDCATNHCHSTGKHPIGAGWQLASVDEWRYARQWLLEGYNIGVYAPKDARVIALDFDDAAAIPLVFPDGVPETMGDSIKGKSHLFFTLPEGVDIDLLPAVFDGGEIAKGGTRHLVAPMCMHPDGERKHNGIWEVKELSVDAIKRLMVMKKETDEERAAATEPGDPGWQITKGRHEWLWSQLGRLRNVMPTYESLLEAIMAVNTARIVPPIDDAHIIRATNDFWNRKTGEPAPITIDFGKKESLSDILETQELKRFHLQPTKSIWRGWLTIGEAIFLDGMSAVGKSTFVMDVIARLTTGQEMPDGTRGDHHLPRDVIYITGEDDPNRILAPRAIASGADLNRIHFVTAEFVMPDDIGRLRNLIKSKPDTSLVFIDPLFAHIGTGKDGKTLNTNSDVEMRSSVMTPLRDLARETGTAILLTRHFNKQQGSDLNMRGSGSYGGLTAAARVVLLISKDPNCEDDDDAKVAGVLKTQYGSVPMGRRFHTVGAAVTDTVDPTLTVGTAVVVWEHGDIGKRIESYLTDADAPATKSSEAKRRDIEAAVLHAVPHTGCITAEALDRVHAKRGDGQYSKRQSHLALNLDVHKHGIDVRWWVKRDDGECDHAKAKAEEERRSTMLLPD